MNESDFEIGIIGGTHGTGRFFADFFRKEGYTVHVAGRTSGMPLVELTERCRVVIIAVPIDATCDVIRKTGPLMGNDSLLADLTSLKVEPVRAMLESSISEVVGIHPLFGPNVPGIAGENIALCPARGVSWFNWLRKVFSRRGALLVECSPEEHDEKMAMIQALIHLDSVLIGLTIKGVCDKMEELGKFSTPVFRARMAMIDRVFASPRLYSGIIAGNPRTKGLFEALLENAEKLRDSLDKADGNIEYFAKTFDMKV